MPELAWASPHGRRLVLSVFLLCCVGLLLPRWLFMICLLVHVSPCRKGKTGQRRMTRDKGPCIKGDSWRQAQAHQLHWAARRPGKKSKSILSFWRKKNTDRWQSVISPSVTQKYFPSPFSLLRWHIDWIEGFFWGGGSMGIWTQDFVLATTTLPLEPSLHHFFRVMPPAFGGSGPSSGTSYLCLPHSWDYRHAQFVHWDGFLLIFFACEVGDGSGLQPQPSQTAGRLDFESMDLNILILQ
jgi:hypothetical protein